MTIAARLRKLENAATVGKYISIPIYDGETEQQALAAAGITEEPPGLLIMARYWTKRSRSESGRNCGCR